MTNDTMTRRVAHPMVRLQRQVQSLVDSRKLQPTDGLWKVGFLFRGTWPQWKEELLDFDFAMTDPIQTFLDVEVWDDD